jgi:hypothetical protein
LNVHQEEDDDPQDEEEDDVGGHQEEDKDKDNLKKRAVAVMLPKNLIARTPDQVSLDGRWFHRPTLLILRARRELGQESSKATR